MQILTLMGGIQKFNLSENMARIQFVARIGPMGKDKLHILLPKDKHEEASKLVGKQVRITIDDELFTT